MDIADLQQLPEIAAGRVGDGLMRCQDITCNVTCIWWTCQITAVA